VEREELAGEVAEAWRIAVDREHQDRRATLSVRRVHAVGLALLDPLDGRVLVDSHAAVRQDASELAYELEPVELARRRIEERHRRRLPARTYCASSEPCSEPHRDVPRLQTLGLPLRLRGTLLRREGLETPVAAQPHAKVLRADRLGDPVHSRCVVSQIRLVRASSRLSIPFTQLSIMPPLRPLAPLPTVRASEHDDAEIGKRQLIS
jgi:hypothetical protein